MQMGDNGDSKHLRAVTINQGDEEIRLERLLAAQTSSDRIRLTSSNPTRGQSQPVQLTEAALILLLQKGIRAGVLSSDFMKNLQSEFEI